MSKEERLKDILNSLEQLKRDFGDLVDEFYNDYADDETMNLLVEASAALDDAIDCMAEVGE